MREIWPNFCQNKQSVAKIEILNWKPTSRAHSCKKLQPHVYAGTIQPTIKEWKAWMTMTAKSH